ncbi:hypothetical protein MIND_01298900 [Mycena indigotica]|uniref:Protein kinase domain-containing protein n=1 Tax=Mycena indigotica TaxID=2126181 RepID=A0A8H6S1H3_9AGAR|nr:uncharacterized protein MIND_01298900 [Mycena indigotica]KAF7290588.1 hypothetical protein MIND_01298900 [Mycena indigotica]
MSATTSTLHQHLDLRPENWENLALQDIWSSCKDLLHSRGYILASSEEYETVGEGLPLPNVARNPFKPTRNENFIHVMMPEADVVRGRHPSPLQTCVEVLLGLDSSLRTVVFKAIGNDSAELAALKDCSSPSAREDTSNHTIPVLDWVETPHGFVIAVMPAWGQFWNDPPCGSMGTRIEMAVKLVEGLQFFHKRGIAHGDIQRQNIVINYFDWRTQPPYKCTDDFRLTCKVEYAYIDFGSAHILSLANPWGIPTTHPTTEPAPEQVPAMEAETEIDLFAADVFNLGKVLQIELDAALRMYGQNHLVSLEEYQSILAQMTQVDPLKRPTIDQALAVLTQCILKMG